MGFCVLKGFAMENERREGREGKFGGFFLWKNREWILMESFIRKNRGECE